MARFEKRAPRAFHGTLENVPQGRSVVLFLAFAMSMLIFILMLIVLIVMAFKALDMVPLAAGGVIIRATDDPVKPRSADKLVAHAVVDHGRCIEDRQSARAVF